MGGKKMPALVLFLSGTILLAANMVIWFFTGVDSGWMDETTFLVAAAAYLKK